MRKLLLLTIFLISQQSFAATWYVRPSADGASGDGTTYATAWTGFTQVLYASMSANDTLKVCGSFVAGDKDTRGGGAAMIFSNPTAGQITIDGDCSANGNLARAKIDGGSAVTYGMYCNSLATCQTQTWKNILATNFTTRGFYVQNNADYADVVTFTGTRLECDNIVSVAASGQWCVAGYGQGATLSYIKSTRTTDDSVHWEGSNFTITDSTLMFPGYNTATGVFIGDCVQNITETDNAQIKRNFCDKRNANADGDVAKSCWVIGDPATGTSGEISDNVCFHPTTGTSTFGSKPILVSTSVTGVRILRNYVYGGYYGIFAFGGGATITGNVVENTTSEGISVPTSTTTGTTIVNNNVVNRSNICYILKGASGAVTILSYNNLAMNCTTYGYEKVTATYTQSNNRCDLATPTCSNNAGTITSVDPGIIKGTFTDLQKGYYFRLKGSSVLKRAGFDLNIGNTQDYANRAFLHPPSIGAFESTAGDEITDRTAATSRTSR